MLLAIFSFSCMEIFVKFLSGQVNTLQILWFRYIVQMVVTLLICLPRLRQVLNTQYPGLQALRSVLVMIATAGFFFGYQKNSLVETNAIAQMAPIFITMGAALFLGEVFGAKRGIALALGMIGALIVLRPGTPDFSPWLLLPLAGTIGYSIYALVTRYVGRSESVWTSAIYAGLLSTVILTCILPFVWVTPTWTHLAMMLAVGSFGTLAQLCLTRAFALAEASTLAPVSYVALIFASIWDLTIFGVIPETHTYVGALVIMASGLYVWWRETRQKASG